MKFSVLMSIYCKEDPMNFDISMRSIWDKQSIKPNEIILVKDGPLTNELDKIIEKWKNKLHDILYIIPLKQNLGLGDALNIGLQYCNYNIVARMDTDDIALPSRFEEQINIFKKNDIDVCGSWVSEFEDSELNIVSCRIVPEYNQEIVNYAKTRCPVNHPSIMYKKDAVQKAGGYKKLMWFEDYYLWARMIISGAKFYNIQKTLVNMRAGYQQLERRRGFKYAMSELKLQVKFKSMKFINSGEFIKNVLIRFTVRILPKSITKLSYIILRKIK